MTETEIEAIINSIKSEYANSAKEFDGMLSGINSKIETLTEGNNSIDTVKNDLNELKTELENRYAFAVENFDNINKAFISLSENQELLSKNSDLRMMFDVLTENINHFAQEISDQQIVINDIDNKIAAFSNDNSRKEEIIENISVLKEALETFNRGFEASIMDINSNLRGIAKSLLTMDVTDQNDIIKRELENIYLTSNAILSTIQIIDQKNDDLAKLTEVLATKNDISLSTDRIGISLEGLSNRINELPQKIDFPDLNIDFTSIIEEIKDLKADLGLVNDKEIDFERLEVKINAVYEGFQSAVVNLGEDKQQAFVSLKDEISQIISGIESLKDLSPAEYTEKIDFQSSKIDEILEVLKIFQGDFVTKSSGNLDKIVDEIEKNRNELINFNSIVSEGLTKYLSSIKELFSTFSGDLKSCWNLIDEKTEGKAKEQFEKLELISSEIKGIDASLIEREESYKEFVQSKIRSLYEFIVDFKAYVNSTNMTIENKVSEKLTALENLLSQGVEVFNQRLAYLGQRIDICLNTVQTFSSETDIKFGNAVSELSDVKDEIVRILDNLTVFNSRNEISFNNFDEKFSGNFGDLKTSLENFCANFETLKYELNQAGIANQEFISEIVNQASKNTSSQIETLGVDLSENINKNTDMIRGFIEVSKDGNNQSLTELNALSDSIKVLESGFSQNAEILKTTLSNQMENINNYIESIKVYMSEHNADSGSKIADKLMSLESSLSEISESYDERFLMLQNKIAEYVNSVDAAKNENGEFLQNAVSSISTELLPVKSALNSFFEIDFNEILDSIKSQIEMSYLNFSADMNENLNENHDSFVKLEESYRFLVQKFANVEAVINDLNLNQLSMISLAINNIEKCSGDSLSQTTEFINDWRKELSRLENKLDINCSNTEKIFKTMLSKVEDIVTSKSIENTEEIKNCISVMINNEDVLYSIDTMNSELTEKFNIFTEELNSDSRKTNDILFGLKTFLEEISDGNSNVKELTGELSAKIDVLALSDTDEKIEELVQSLHDKIDEIADNDNGGKVEDLINALHEKVDVIALSDADEKIEEMVNALHDKVDVLALSDDSELINEIQDIKDLILEQRKQIEEFGDNARSSDVDKHLSDLLADISRIEKSVNEFDLEKNASDIKDTMMTAILSVADQISFVEETEEIKDFVEERTDEINKNLLDVKKQLSNIVCNSDGWDYSYTMQDIESDIAKLRIILSDISSSSSRDEINEISDNIHKIASSVNNMQNSLTQDQIVGLKNDFEKLNDDIVSISSRTNKLLLTSDESYRALTSGLDEFSRVINDLEHRIDVIDNSEINERIEKKLDGINAMVTSSSNSDKVMREVMMYLGEWIDGTSEKIENIIDDTSDIHSISYAIGQVRELMPEKQELINVIENKFEDQQNRIDILELKLERVLAALDQKDSTNLENKIDKIENQLNKLTSSIEKLASFIDEE